MDNRCFYCLKRECKKCSVEYSEITFSEYWNCCLKCVPQCNICNKKCLDNGDYCEKCNILFCQECIEKGSLEFINYNCCNVKRMFCKSCVVKKEYKCSCYKLKKYLNGRYIIGNSYQELAYYNCKYCNYVAKFCATCQKRFTIKNPCGGYPGDCLNCIEYFRGCIECDIESFTKENPYNSKFERCLNCVPNCKDCNYTCSEKGSEECKICNTNYCKKCVGDKKIKIVVCEYCKDENYLCNSCVSYDKYPCNCYYLEVIKSKCIICNSKDITEYKCSNEKCKYNKNKIKKFCNKCIIICDKCDNAYCKDCDNETISCRDCGCDFCKECNSDDICDCYKECAICDERTHYEDMESCDNCNIKLCSYCNKNNHKCKKTKSKKK